MKAVTTDQLRRIRKLYADVITAHERMRELGEVLHETGLGRKGSVEAVTEIDPLLSKHTLYKAYDIAHGRIAPVLCGMEYAIVQKLRNTPLVEQERAAEAWVSLKGCPGKIRFTQLTMNQFNQAIRLTDGRINLLREEEQKSARRPSSKPALRYTGEGIQVGSYTYSFDEMFIALPEAFFKRLNELRATRSTRRAAKLASQLVPA